MLFTQALCLHIACSVFQMSKSRHFNFGKTGINGLEYNALPLAVVQWKKPTKLDYITFAIVQQDVRNIAVILVPCSALSE